MLDCGAPFAATGVIIEPFDNTKFGSLITFHCDGSNITMTAVCDSNGEWIPNPASFNCGDDSLGNISFIKNHEFTLCFLQFPVDHQLLQLMVTSPTTLVMLRIQLLTSIVLVPLL